MRRAGRTDDNEAPAKRLRDTPKRVDQTLPVAASSALYRFFRPGYSSVSCSSNDLQFQGSPNDPDSRVALDSVFAWEVRPGWFWNRLTIHVQGDAVHEIGGLSAAGADSIHSFLAAYAARSAAVLGPFTRNGGYQDRGR